MAREVLRLEVGNITTSAVAQITAGCTADALPILEKLPDHLQEEIRAEIDSLKHRITALESRRETRYIQAPPHPRRKDETPPLHAVSLFGSDALAWQTFCGWKFGWCAGATFYTEDAKPPVPLRRSCIERGGALMLQVCGLVPGAPGLQAPGAIPEGAFAAAAERPRAERPRAAKRDPWAPRAGQGGRPAPLVTDGRSPRRPP